MDKNKFLVEIDGELIETKELKLKSLKFSVHLIKSLLSPFYSVYTTISQINEKENSEEKPMLVFYRNDLTKEQAKLYYKNQVQLYCE